MAISKETEKLLDVGFIRKVMYLIWLANVEMMTKDVHFLLLISWWMASQVMRC